jgi:hypothetical protein
LARPLVLFSAIADFGVGLGATPGTVFGNCRFWGRGQNLHQKERLLENPCGCKFRNPKNDPDIEKEISETRSGLKTGNKSEPHPKTTGTVGLRPIPLYVSNEMTLVRFLAIAGLGVRLRVTPGAVFGNCRIPYHPSLQYPKNLP